jgi:hypothetical protein
MYKVGTFEWAQHQHRCGRSVEVTVELCGEQHHYIYAPDMNWSRIGFTGAHRASTSWAVVCEEDAITEVMPRALLGAALYNADANTLLLEYLLGTLALSEFAEQPVLTPDCGLVASYWPYCALGYAMVGGEVQA